MGLTCSTHLEENKLSNSVYSKVPSSKKTVATFETLNISLFVSINLIKLTTYRYKELDMCVEK